mmetsp:Transcript_33422/g.38505  ORF Transcript_33422/g.38505 Transcript_33422/m.38505 type:complete len:490 (-) Transcript_33422:133-1602(-)
MGVNKRLPRLINGQVVVLNNGKGTTRKYNGKDAIVVDYPTRSCWMTVSVRGIALKWRKGQYSIVPDNKITGWRMLQQSQKKSSSLLQVTNDNVVVKIFSFLVGTTSHDIILDEDGREQQQNQLLFVKDAAIVYSKLAIVSRTWKRICNNNTFAIFGRLNVNLDAVSTEKIVPCIHWLCKNKFSIGSLIFKAELGDVVFLEQLLDTCDTSKLTHVRAYCQSVDKYNNCLHISMWVNEAYYHQRNNVKKKVIFDLCGSGGDIGLTTLKAMSREMNVPYGDSPTQRQLHDTIATNCQNLLELEMSMAVPNGPTNCREYLSESLFSLTNIYKLDVSLGVVAAEYGRHSFDGMIVTRMVENLGKLLELNLKSSQYAGDCMLHIVTPSLTILNVSGLAKSAWVSGVLPKLKAFICNGGPCGNGIVPLFTAEQKRNVRISGGEQKDVHFYCGQATIRRLDVPYKCEFTLKCCALYSRYDVSYNLQHFLDTRVETFE